MKTRQIGNTNVKVTDISFGCASIGNLYQEVSDADAAAVLDHAWEAGIRYFDTAPHYGRGRSEMRLGNFLSGKNRDDYVISTKVGRVTSPGEQLAEADCYINPLPNNVRYDYSGDGIEESLERSRERLQTDYIDIIYVHDIGAYTHGAEANAPHMEAFLGSGYERLVKLKEQGKIGAFGLGVNENEVCLDIMAEGKLDVILLAGRLTLLDRSAEEKLVAKCKADNTSLVLGGVMNSGILATGPVEGATYDYAPAPQDILDKVGVLQEKAEAMGLPLATAAMLFAREHEMCASLLIGTSRISSLQRNLDAMDVETPAQFADVFDL